MEPETAIVPIEQAEATLFGSSDPDIIVARATAQAKALADVIRKRGLFKKIGPKEHVFVEGWTLCGSMLGVFPVCVWTRPMEGNEGQILGWEARVEARTIQGHVVGAAEAQCMYAEKNWSNRDDFALRSMAQTRATSKALRMPLGFVVTLAGYSATPAEEMAVEASPEPQDEGSPSGLGPERYRASIERGRQNLAAPGATPEYRTRQGPGQSLDAEQGSPLYPSPDLEPALQASIDQIQAKKAGTELSPGVREMLEKARQNREAAAKELGLRTCSKCGAQISVYTARAGHDFEQCSAARKSKEVYAEGGHHYRKLAAHGAT